MENQGYIKIQHEFPDTHYFLYKNKQYPIKMKYFKLSSKYFQRNQDKFKNTKAINLIDIENQYNDDEDSRLELSDETINHFIQYVQHQQIPLNNENVIGLNYLSERFEIDELKENTSQYINNHQEDLVLDLLQDSKFQKINENGIYEGIISNNISRFIDDDRLIDLRISTLYRIFSKFQQNRAETKTKTIKEKINQFIFKCLDKYGQMASILLSFLENDQISIENISMILNNYYEIVDFEYINKNLLKKIFDEYKQATNNFQLKLNEQIEINRKSSKLIDELKNEKIKEKEKFENEHSLQLMEIKNIQDKMNQEINRITNEHKKVDNEYLKKLENKENEIQLLKNEIQKHETEIKSLKEEQKKLELKQKNEIIRIKNENDKKLEIEKRKYEEILSKIQEQNQFNTHSIPYNQGQEFKGIFNYLAGLKEGNIHDNKTIEVTSNSIASGNHPKYLLNQNSSSYEAEQGASNFWICFDFKNKQVEVSNYTIKSSDDPKNIGKIKSWIIEISNDGKNWTNIDEHSNSNELNGQNIIKTFQTKPNVFSRYVRFHHNGEYWGSSIYWLYINSIEFYGRLKIPK